MTTDTTGTSVHPFAFTGKGGEYFRIWIVNIALTIVTLGIYSAWAKVRRLQYFYRNTTLAGGSFDYHGDPVSILKGRLIGVGLLLTYHFTVSFNLTLGLIVLAILMVVFPVLLQRSLRFKLHNSSYRGLRFHFAGSTGEAYKTFLLWPVLSYITLGLLMPLAHQRIKAYQHGNSRYGSAPFQLGRSASADSFYGIYFKMFLMLLVPLILFIVLGGLWIFQGLGDMQGEDKMAMIEGLFFIMLGLYLAAMLLIGPWFAARTQNLVWNATALSPHHFASQVRARDLLVIYLTNFLGIVFTLGLYKPFADIRLAKYRVEHMALHAVGDFDAFVADQSQSVGAAGEETAEVFDMDISF